jgi:hypothetical protein
MAGAFTRACFSGNGVAPAVFAGRVLAGLVDEPQGDLARLPIVDRAVAALPASRCALRACGWCAGFDPP